MATVAWTQQVLMPCEKCRALKRDTEGLVGVPGNRVRSGVCGGRGGEGRRVWEGEGREEGEGRRKGEGGGEEGGDGVYGWSV